MGLMIKGTIPRVPHFPHDTRQVVEISETGLQPIDEQIF